ncbi:glutamate--tRNA ligase [Acetobacter fallax]|uniref:Glutamate--tRNA ligase n=1 Tax=Acetobacter fallax TaxID=1737473 RepID=A0ABX0K612_9PROT|nr:glutamate--tRNA ligase [Acetobacter fallax]NHO31325.1 glutamate--tRNA ligase [Acetobacter fallax]NHO34882.1 glutamate--tRNA ligase [Acetobacter fallax]
MTVRTRFAPSPTGLLHIGNARAALFNFLYARHHGGEFLLRIEDTDRERSTQKAVDVIFDGLSWMGITADAEPVFQSTCVERHKEVALQLLAAGKAYKCFCTPEELKQMREQAMAEGRPPRYNGMWRDRDPSEAPPGAPYAVRIRADHEGETVIEDLVQGEVRVANAELDDMIILRSDGTPTYQHAVVVDDHDMAITHVIRGDDHLTNTFRQLMIYRAMGWDQPRFAHLPLIHGPDGAKLSKRHGAQSVVEFRDEGFLPEALCNYLLRLGWGHGDAEILSRDEQIKLFDLDGVGRSPSRMDYTKLTHVNAVYLREADDERLTNDVMERLAGREGVDTGAITRERVLKLMPGLKERARTLVELADSAAFLGRQVPLSFDAKAQKNLTPESTAMLGELARALAVVDPFSAEQIDSALRQFAETHGHKLGQVAQPLRAALTGTATSPGIDATVAALGRDEVLARIGAVQNG